jgi:hypothetical protein
MRLRFLGAPLLVYGLVLLFGISGASGTATTTNPSVYVPIHVTITDSKVKLYPRSEPRGSIARFIVRNAGSKSVMFSVGKQSAGLGDLFGFRTTLRPGAQKTLLLYLARRGLVPYYLGDSYQQAKVAERGQLVVGATCSVCAPPGPPRPP